MDYTHLGRSGVSVSRLCLGTMSFGAITDEAASHQIMDRAHEHGINFFCRNVCQSSWRCSADLMFELQMKNVCACSKSW